MSYCSPNPNGFLSYIDENKLFSFLTTFTFVVVGVFIYILRSYSFFKKRHVPQAVHPTAPFGNIKDILFQDTTLYVYLWKYYNKFKRKGYKYGGLYLFLKPGVLIVDPILTQTILSEEKSLVDVYREKCLQNYKHIVDLFNNENLNNFFIKFNDIKGTLIADLKEKSITTAMHNFFMETTCAAFGFKSSVDILDTINAALKEKTSSSFTHYFCLVYPIFKRNKSTHDLYVLMKNTIEYRKKNDIREKDLIQSFIDLTNEGIYSLEEIVPELLNIFVDNLIYSYSTVLFCLHALASNEDIQNELTGEIRRFNKEHKSVNLDNLEKLVYLDAVVKETLRKYPPVPTVIKQCKEDYRVAEFDLDLPKGSFILATVFGIHHDPTNFPDPEKFDPDRFSEDKEFIKSNAYFPFESDLRKNIGFRFTSIHIKLALISILSSYKVGIDSKYVLEFDTGKLSVNPKEPLPLIFEPL